MNTHRVVALRRNSPFLVAQWNESYVFDNPVPADDLARVRQQAASLALVLGQAAPAAAAAGGGPGAWRVADPSARSFGDEVPAMVVLDPNSFLAPGVPGDEDYLSGLVLIDNCWTSCQLVADSDKDAWECALVSGHKRDPRVAGEVRDPVTKQLFVAFSESLGLQHTAA